MATWLVQSRSARLRSLQRKRHKQLPKLALVPSHPSPKLRSAQRRTLRTSTNSTNSSSRINHTHITSTSNLNSIITIITSTRHHRNTCNICNLFSLITIIRTTSHCSHTRPRHTSSNNLRVLRHHLTTRDKDASSPRGSMPSSQTRGVLHRRRCKRYSATVRPCESCFL